MEYYDNNLGRDGNIQHVVVPACVHLEIEDKSTQGYPTVCSNWNLEGEWLSREASYRLVVVHCKVVISYTCYTEDINLALGEVSNSKLKGQLPLVV